MKIVQMAGMFLAGVALGFSLGVHYLSTLNSRAQKSAELLVPPATRPAPQDWRNVGDLIAFSPAVKQVHDIEVDTDVVHGESVVGPVCIHSKEPTPIPVGHHLLKIDIKDRPSPVLPDDPQSASSTTSESVTLPESARKSQ
jgi:hypothetical protein